MNRGGAGDLQSICRLLQAQDDFLVCSHHNPDGDALGSVLAMYHLLVGLGKRVTVYVPDPIPDGLRFLPGCDVVMRDIEGRRFHWLLLLDCATPDRVGESFAKAAPFAHSIVLDHHLTERAFGNHRYVDPAAAATGEIVDRVARALAWTPSADYATCIFTAVSTDTGSFRFSNTSAAAMAIAAAMVAAGAKPHEIAEELFENQPLRRIRVMADVLDTLEVTRDGRIAVTTVRYSVLTRHGATKEDLEGLIDINRSIHGVWAAAQIREIEERPAFRVSLRSKYDVDVEAVARRFSGGGHKHAAGCTLYGDYDAVKRTLLAALAEAVAAGQGSGA